MGFQASSSVSIVTKYLAIAHKFDPGVRTGDWGMGMREQGEITNTKHPTPITQ
ncbi:hypothetical protein H6G64_04350 [Calothrix sp. FACHB-156]|nr:hypothetical protein [Calothrix sp. FACHB-156]